MVVFIRLLPAWLFYGTFAFSLSSTSGPSQIVPLENVENEAQLVDTSSFLPLHEEDFASFPDEIIASNDPELLANSNADCERSVGKIRRRAEVCPPQSKTPPTGVKTPIDENGVFPPPGSNEDRLPGFQNDPKPRSKWSGDVANSAFDFEFCGSGPHGYRNYAICDSGDEKDNLRGAGGWYTLWRVTRRKLP